MSANRMAKERLLAERKRWRSDHPPNFYAKPEINDDGSVNLMRWRCGIPGRAGTSWEGGVYKLTLEFPDDYPTKPPKCQFTPLIFHPNVYPSGTVCLSILNAEKDWRPLLTIKDILMGIQDLLTTPNENDPAQKEPFELYRDDKEQYEVRIREQARKFPPA